MTFLEKMMINPLLKFSPHLEEYDQVGNYLLGVMGGREANVGVFEAVFAA